jgi:hypothetical protein
LWNGVVREAIGMKAQSTTLSIDELSIRKLNADVRMQFEEFDPALNARAEQHIVGGQVDDVFPGRVTEGCIEGFTVGE